jgi:hypothetical protein
MKTLPGQGTPLSRNEKSKITGGAAAVRCFWFCSTPTGPVTFPVGTTCNIAWLIDPCLQYGGVTKGCKCY